jgi:hypothetical protein
LPSARNSWHFRPWSKILIAVLALGFCTGQPTGILAAGNCVPAQPERFAFARVGPLQVRAEPNSSVSSGLELRFARAYPVSASDNENVALCVDGQQVWARRAQVYEVRSPHWVVLPEARSTDDRPMLRFWRSQDRLGAHLSTSSTALAPPDYEEVRAADVVGTVRFPVFHRDVMEMTFDNKQLEVASVLVPFRANAVTAYRALRELASVSGVMIIDLSGSTAGLIAPLLRSLQASHGDTAAAPPRLLIVSVGGNGLLLGAESRMATDLDSLPLRHREQMLGGTSDQTTLALASIGRLLAPHAGDLPLVVVAGGDVALQSADWSGADRLWVVQATPELQDRLRRSVAGFGGNVTYLPFSPGNGARLHDLLAESWLDTPSPSLRSSDYAAVAALGAQPGMIGLLPKDLDSTEHLATPPAYATDGAEWFAIPLWVVVDGLLLQFD